LNVNLPDNADLLTQLANKTGVVGTQWNNWQTSWTGVPVVSTDVTQVTVTGNNVAPAGNNWPVRIDTITRTTSTQTVGQNRTGIQTTVQPRTVTRDLGNRIVSVDIIPYIRSREITVGAVRMKPNTKVYAFFDDVNVSSYCKPSGGNYGDDLITDSHGAISGITFNIPNTSSLKFRTGERIFKLTDSNTDGDDNTTEATAKYVASGLLQDQERTILSTRVAQVDSKSVSQARVVTNVSVQTTIDHGGWFDPLSQTFLVQEDGGCFVSSIEIFFKEKDANIPVTVQLRSTTNGYPSRYVFPFGQATLNPSSVNVSEDASVSTKFTFPDPVYMLPNTEYCFIVMSDSNAYRIYTGRIGDKILGTDRIISQQPYTGVMFLSQNASTWTADQTQDIMFKLNKCVFDISSSSDILFNNEALPTELLETNPLYTTNSSAIVRVYHPNSGFINGDSVVISGIASGTYNGYAHTVLNATHVVSNVDYDGYDITLGTNATGTGDIGGNAVYATRNVLMDVCQPNIAQTILSGTEIDWKIKTTTGKHPHGSQTPYSISSSYAGIQVNDNNYFTQPMIIASQLNETNKLGGSKSLFVNATLTSDNANISPKLKEPLIKAQVVSKVDDALPTA
jgi:hypothetical protein